MRPRPPTNPFATSRSGAAKVRKPVPLKCPSPDLFKAFDIDIKVRVVTTPAATPPAEQMTFAELQAISFYTPASAFAHITDEVDLGRALLAEIGNLDRCDPEIKALLERAKGTYWGDIAAAHFIPAPTKLRPLRRKKWTPGRKSPPLASLFDE